MPEWYLNKLEAIQKLVFCLQTQPAYFVSLAIALRQEYERQVLVEAIKQVQSRFGTICCSSLGRSKLLLWGTLIYIMFLSDILER